MGLITEKDVQTLAHDPELVADVVKTMMEDPEAMDDLADEIADKFEDELEENPDLRKQIMEAAVTNAEFKKKIVAKLVSDLG